MDMLSNTRKVLITGGNGYIAKSLADKLSGVEITTIDRKNFDLTNYDQVCEYFENNQFDTVIHTAIKGGSRLAAEDNKVFDDNMNMFWNLASNNDSFKKFISFGSGAELYATETPYGHSKRVIAEAMEDRPNFYNIRIYAVFDENELDTRFIKGNILRYIKGEEMIIHRDKEMDFFYMQDLITLVQHYIDNDNLPKTVDCSYETHCTLSEIANKINKLDNHKVDITIMEDEPNISYIGRGGLINLSYIGLDEGMKQVYQLIKNKTYGIFPKNPK